MGNAKGYYAFTLRNNQITRSIRTKIFVANGIILNPSRENPENCGAKEYIGLWDTGATISALSPRVVDELDLPTSSVKTANTGGGPVLTTIHRVHFWLPNKVVVEKCLASRLEGLKHILNVDLLIGMDVMSRGDFAMSNSDGKTVVTFRIPSVEVTDYCL